MKKIIIIAFIFTFGNSFSQENEEFLNIKKGTWNLGGKVSFLHNNYENKHNDNNPYENKLTNLNFEPQIGYAVGNNFSIGIGLGYGYSKNKSNSYDYESVENTYSVFPYVKKYFSVGKKLTINLQGELRYTEFENNNEISENDRSGNKLFIGIRPGITYFLNKNLALDSNIGSLGYSTSKYDDYNHNEKSNGFNFSLNSSALFFGLSYYL